MDPRTDGFKLKDNYLTASENAMNEYRERWTCGNHNFGRQYIGTIDANKFGRTQNEGQ